MDDLWPRFRKFWTPLLLGAGAFLVSVVVVHMATRDGAEIEARNRTLEAELKRAAVPPRDATEALLAEEEVLKASLQALATRLAEVREGAALVEGLVADALREVYLRGLDPAPLRAALDSGNEPRVVEAARAFENDPRVLRAALRDYEAGVAEQVEQFRTQDPNVGFSRLKSRVRDGIAARANRGNVELGQADLGLASIVSVESANLPRHLVVVALVARLANAAVLGGAEKIESVSVGSPPAGQAAEAFLQEYPVACVLTGTAGTLERIVAAIADPTRPLVVSEMKSTRDAKRNGVVKLSLRADALRVDPEALKPPK